MTTNTEDSGTVAAQRPSGGAYRRLLILLPLFVVLGLVALFFVSLETVDPQRLPSVLIGKPVPVFALAPIPRENSADAAFPGFASSDLAKGEPSIVNVWASWCAPCAIEQPTLLAFAKESGVPLYGLNYKDKPDAARSFLGRFGNPFKAIGMDESGRIAIEFGVYGVPETFVIDGKGRIVTRYPGPLTADAIKNEIMPALEKAKAASRPLT
jgi:cytochrome c biogenesis protein CcmG/thiol:disulfide interchange protein DsbE